MSSDSSRYIKQARHWSRSTGRITVDELILWLSETTPVRRRAILFGLESKMPVKDIIDLSWKKLLSNPHVYSGFALSLANATPRHLRLPYVFWEPMEGIIAGPLFGLAETVLNVSQGMGYTALQNLYDNAIPIDCSADLDHFSNVFCQELDNRILQK